MVTRTTTRPKGEQAKPPEKPKTERTDQGPGSLAGNLTRDPELRYTQQGKPLASMRVAVSERVYNERAGKWEDGPTEFFSVTAFGQLGENIAEYLEKGDRIVAEGRWESQTWTDSENVVQERIVLIAADLGPSMRFRGARPEAKQSGPRS